MTLGSFLFGLSFTHDLSRLKISYIDMTYISMIY